MRRPTILLLWAAFLLAGCSSGAMPFALGSSASPSASAVTDNESELYLGVIDGLIKQGRHGAALAFLNTYAQSDTSPAPRYWLLRGDALLGLGRDSEASAAFAKLQDTALAAAGWNGMGRAAANRHDWMAADADFRKAVDGEPANANFLSNLGFADLHLNKAGSSAAWLQQAYELDPGSDLIRNNLVIALTLKGDGARADAIMADIKDDNHRAAARALVKNALVTFNKGERS